MSGFAGNLTEHRTKFVGRRAEIGTVRRLLGRSRLVTLVGTGGCGKSRLAARIGAGLVDKRPDGVWWVDLAAVQPGQSVVEVVARTLGLREQFAENGHESLQGYLRGRSPLIILDNCEHLLDACAEALDLMLAGCPGVRLLATSREPVGVGGETVWRVPSLSMPDPESTDSVRGLASCDSVRLFVDRAQLALPSFRLHADNAAAVAQVCCKLDGIPLAIELAAARVAALAPTQIAEALDNCFTVLRGRDRGCAAVPRHRTLRTSMDWSHELLDDDERVVFRRLGIFVGSFGLDATGNVCGGDGVDGRDVLDRLTRLAAKSLVVVEQHGATHRYRLLEAVRQYAVERLAEAGETVALRDRHLECALALVEHAAPEMETGRQSAWLRVLDAEYPNLRAALEWSIAQRNGEGALRLVNGMALFHLVRGHTTQGRRCFAEALAVGDPAPSPQRARALWGAGCIAFHAADQPAAREYATAALEMARGLGDLPTAARALAILGNIGISVNPRRARTYLDESLELARQCADDWCLAYAMCLTATSWMLQCALEPARQWFAQSRGLVQRVGSEHMLAWYWLTAAWVALRAGELGEASAAAGRAAGFATAVDDPICLTAVALCAAEVDCWLGRAQAARDCVATLRAQEGRSTRLALGAMYLHTASGKTALALGELEEADRELRLGVELARHNADVLCEGECLAGLAEVALLRGHADQARATAEEVGRCAAGLDNAWLASVGHLLLARSARAEGDFDKALLLGHQALSLQREGGYLLDAVVTLEVIAGIQAWRGAYVDAARLSGSADAARRSLGAQHRPVDVAWHQADRTRLLQVFGEGALRDARREGAALTLDEAVSYASRGRGPRGRDAAGWGSLTPTEMTVVRLVAEGLTNTEIAQRVLVSRATVKVHLSHVFGKLAVANRTELAAQAGRRFTDRSAAPGDP